MNAPIEIPTLRLKQDLQRWRKHIERALREADLMTFEDIERDVVAVKKLYFDNGRAFCVVDVQDYSKGRVCHILAAGGSLSGLKELQATLIPFFKLIGARRLTQAGRLGWAKVLPSWGWKQSRVLMELDLDT
jgi:hypothetical protein